MMPTWSEINEGIREARQTVETADRHVNQMTGLIAGRLRIADVDSEYLIQLKTELRDFNIQTRRWKEKA